MALFDSKVFNPEVFARYMRDTVPDLKLTKLIESGVLEVHPEFAAMARDQVGGNYITIPVKDNIGGDPVNYDGDTNITASSRKTFQQGCVVVGRAKGFTEKDFSYDITGGENFLPLASEVRAYWDHVDQNTLLKTLEGVFSMGTAAANTAFVTKHTYDITSETTKTIGATTLNTAMQRALGDNKSAFSVAIMHSVVATNLENLQLIEYAKYTDKNGITRSMELGTLNGRLVLIDDGMPVLNGYIEATSATTGALKVVASSPSTGEIALATVTGSDFYPSGVAADDYVLPETRYVTYVFGKGAIMTTDFGAKVPYEMSRDASTDGGIDTLYTRQRKMFAPKGITFSASLGAKSPTDAQLATGSYWSLASDGATSSPTYFDDKAIPIARIISVG